jgi:hypothetical protein
MAKIEIIGYPEGNILKVTQKQFDLLNDEDLVMFDDEWTEEKPNGQWGFRNDDEEKIKKLIK